MQVTRRTLNHSEVSADTDSAVAWSPIPGGGALTNVWLDVHIKGNRIFTYQAMLYGMSGFIIPVEDVDSGDSVQDLWDRYVPKPKDLAVNAYDPNTGVAGGGEEDADARFEPGEIDVVSLIEENVDALKEIYRREGVVSFASSPTGYETDETYTGVDRFKVRIKSRSYCKRPSYVVFAVSSPAMTSEGGEDVDMINDQEFIVLKYLQEFLDDAWKALINMTAAIVPYTTMIGSLDKIIAPSMLEATNDAFRQATWQVFTKGTWQFTVPGRPAKTTISSR